MVTALLPCCCLPGLSRAGRRQYRHADRSRTSAMCSHVSDTPVAAPVRKMASRSGQREALVSSANLEGPEMDEQRDLEGVSALVTGASSGIGRAAAEELARHGAEVIVHGRDAGRGSAVVDRITAAGGKARFVAADLSDLAQLDDLAGQAGGGDVLGNNAGVSWFGPTGELDVATFDQLFAANVRAPFFLVAALAPRMA